MSTTLSARPGPSTQDADVFAPLAVPTALTREQATAVAAALNPVIADALALYVKLKNFHWHLAGSHFRDYHLLFDEQAEATLADVDRLAERVRKTGGTTLRSIGHVARLTQIDDDAYVPPRAMVERLLADHQAIAQSQRAATEAAEANKDYPTANVLEEVLDATERRTWFLCEILQGGDHVA